jgi:hypothetical protein
MRRWTKEESHGGYRILGLLGGDNLPTRVRDKKDAELIAAAPDLLEAVEYALDASEKTRFVCDDETFWRLRDSARKARGSK